MVSKTLTLPDLQSIMDSFGSLILNLESLKVYSSSEHPPSSTLPQIATVGLQFRFSALKSDLPLVHSKALKNRKYLAQGACSQVTAVEFCGNTVAVKRILRTTSLCLEEVFSIASMSFQDERLIFITGRRTTADPQQDPRTTKRPRSMPPSNLKRLSTISRASRLWHARQLAIPRDGICRDRIPDKDALHGSCLGCPS